MYLDFQTSVEYICHFKDTRLTVGTTEKKINCFGVLSITL